MVKKTSLLVLTVAATISAIVCFQLALTKRPKGLTATNPVCDLGKQLQAASTNARFTLVNDSPVPIEIIGVKVPCSCMTSSVPKKSIVPGESIDVTIKWNLGTSRGVARVNALAFYKIGGSKDAAALPLAIICDIYPDFDCTVKELAFVWPKAGDQDRSQTFSIIPKNLADVTIKKAYSSHSAFTVDLSGPREVRVVMDYTRWHGQEGVTPFIAVETTSEREPVLRIPLRMVHPGS